MRAWRGVVSGASIALGVALQTSAANAQSVSVYAAHGTPRIDGRLDDAAWLTAPWTDNFRQREPNVGAAGTHHTRARILYDEDALYVAIDMPTSGRPEARLARRDTLPPGERVTVMIDSRGEGSNAFIFATNPAGVQRDAMYQSDADVDDAWDGNWDVETERSDGHWTAEFRIPWRTLRFDTQRTRFGIQIERVDFRRGETTALVPIETEATRSVARFAHIDGLRGVHPQRAFELRPYLVGRYRAFVDPDQLDPTPTWSGTLGADVKLGITNDLVVDATINPDFGQVEVDPAIVNLTTYEPFFPERRPFFLEGSDLMRTPITLLHTRRIGAAPDIPNAPHGGNITAIDPVASIWGAARVTGRIGTTSVMLLDGFTGPTHAREQYSGTDGRPMQSDLQVTPMTNWLAARVRGAISPGSYLGAMVTHVGRFGLPSDLVGGVDWDLRGPGGTHQISGQVAASNAWNPYDGTHSGQAAILRVERAEDSVWTWFLGTRFFSHDFDPNGLGYLERPNLLLFEGGTRLRSDHQVGAIRSVGLTAEAWAGTDMSQLLVDQAFKLSLSITTLNQWSFGIGGRTWVPQFDDRETRGGMPFAIHTGVSGSAFIDSDPRARLRPSAFYEIFAINGGFRTNLVLGLSWNPLPAVAISLQETLRTVRNDPRWVANETNAEGGTDSLFGRQNADIFDTTLRASVSVSRRISFDLFSQFLYESLNYAGYSRLVAPDRLEPAALSTSYNEERVALTVNAVARYEYLRGSFFSLVLVHREGIGVDPTDYRFGEGAPLVFRAQPDTTILAKLTYLLL